MRTKGTKFLTYHQNNSGGYYLIDDNVKHYVIIEGYDLWQIEAMANSILSAPCSLIILIRSCVFNQTVAVLSLGCTPIKEGSFIKSLSRYIIVLVCSSFNRPSGVTAPEDRFKIFIKSLSEVKLKGRVPAVFWNSLRFTFLFPLIVIR